MTEDRERRAQRRVAPSAPPPVSTTRPLAAAPTPLVAPACDHRAEAAVVSAVIMSERALDEVRDIVEPIDFLHGPSRDVFEAVLAIDRRGVRPDIVSIAHELEVNGRLGRIGGTAFLGELIDATPSVANLAEHARIVRHLGLLRRSMTTLRELLSQASKAETRGRVPAFLQHCEAELFAAASQAQSKQATSSTVRELVTATLDAIDPNRPRPAPGISTGWREVDDLSLGYRPGDLWYLAARPGMGKTAFALGSAVAVASAGHHAIFFSLEMGRAALGQRMLSAQSGVPSRRIIVGDLDGEQWGHVLTASTALAHLPLVVDDARGLSPSRLRSLVRRHSALLREKHGGKLALVVVDYVQLMSDDAPAQGQRRQPNRNEELERISKALKDLAREFECTVVALSQLKREDDKASSTRPKPSDLRGSGQLEADADRILFIHRDKGSDDGGDAELILAKGRESGTGQTVLTWEPWCVRFRSIEQTGFAWGAHRED